MSLPVASTTKTLSRSLIRALPSRCIWEISFDVEMVRSACSWLLAIGHAEKS
ncbi:hypothetical protein D3C86_1990500 [compost metagenome]